ncbi:hypothetical protein PVAP13_5KG585100 [Panicum virgatum]|uniref:Uncharacterized protein n=1 Tax=Panicum virgatum TaxID=38727 RepID=A0A8T0SWC9_PANVG|nr:hypothetical protein PVAP13_5KG585100 [Panicum virgatum]
MATRPPSAPVRARGRAFGLRRSAAGATPPHQRPPSPSTIDPSKPSSRSTPPAPIRPAGRPPTLPATSPPYRRRKRKSHHHRASLSPRPTGQGHCSASCVREPTTDVYPRTNPTGSGSRAPAPAPAPEARPGRHPPRTLRPAALCFRHLAAIRRPNPPGFAPARRGGCCPKGKPSVSFSPPPPPPPPRLVIACVASRREIQPRPSLLSSPRTSRAGGRAM